MPVAATAPDLIAGKAVRSLVEAQAIRAATILGQPGGWAVLVRYGTAERAIAAQRSRHMRLWRNIATAVAFVRDELGLPRFEVDASAHDAGAGGHSRPDTAARQRRAHEAVAHDAWFRSEVEKTIAGLGDGSVRLIGEEEWRDIATARRADLDRRIPGRAR
jgi:hypothetical protein